ncbi:hypothetical protein R1CP_23555 [Rhodococcus opacus]|uniref:Uncharacterized protein n=1 Tax=Rhodococcus opacus TaxID=37919 RepID=A0A1B1K9Y2_RHOOP|nr:hypothetical protein [Rhodococcus opacus]ANS29379.1 hypothetical protein R1CP_23555 [Rhodococcus opacus]
MNHTELRTRETRLRRAAVRQGLRMEKSRRRDTRATDYGTYHLVEAETNDLKAHGLPRGYGLSLDDVERALNGEL